MTKTRKGKQKRKQTKVFTLKDRRKKTDKGNENKNQINKLKKKE